ncbi:MAG: hypothetical protein H6807_08350 [Planctomycetes bacterium]|nr:hypothetical protein [Planctomycetota bacterium]
MTSTENDQALPPEARPLRRRLAWLGVLLLLVAADLAFLPALRDDSLRAPAEIKWHFPPFANERRPVPIGNAIVQDWVVQFEGWQRQVREAWRAGRLPLWSPFAGCGAPLAANMQSEAFSPFVPVNLLAGDQYPDWRQFLQLLIAQLGCLLLARQFRLGPLAGLIAALGFSTSWYLQVWAVHPHTASACFAPGILAALCALRRRIDPPRLLLVAGLVAAAILAGHIETAFKAGLTAGIVAALWSPDGLEPRRRAAFLGAAVVATLLGLLLAAVLLLPFHEMAEASLLFRSRSGQSVVDLAPVHALTLLDENLLGNPRAGHDAWQGSRNYNECSFFLGRTIVLLAVLGALIGLRRRPGLALPLLIAGMVPLAIVFGPIGWQEALARIPPFDSMVMSRLAFVAVLPVAMLAGLGIELLLETERDRRLARSAPVLAGLAIAGLVALVIRQGERAPEISRPSLYLFGAAVLAAGLAAQPARLGRVLAVLVLVGLIGVEARRAWFDFIPTVPASVAEGSTPILTGLRVHAGDDRCLIVGLMPPGIDDPTRLHRLRRYDPVESARLYDMCWATPINPLGRDLDIAFGRPAILDALALRWLLSPFDPRRAVMPRNRIPLPAGADTAIALAADEEVLVFASSGPIEDSGLSVGREGQPSLPVRADAAPDGVGPSRRDPALDHFCYTYGPTAHSILLRGDQFPGEGALVFRAPGPGFELILIGRGGLGQDLRLHELARGWLQISERPGAMPAAYLARGLELARNEGEALLKLRDPDFDPRRTTVVEPAPGGAPLVDGRATIAAARLERLSPEHLRIHLPDRQGGVLVVAESWAPGWSHRQGNSVHRAFPANVGMMAVVVPAGMATVDLHYRPDSLVRGAQISAATLLLSLAWLFWWWRRRRARAGARPG